MAEFTFDKRWLALNPETGCWIWQGCKWRDGYGRKNYEGKPGGFAHRWIYELVNGPLDDEVVLRHRCDNPPCCNPEHLIPGTHADNHADMIAKGRNYTSVGKRLDEDRVREIRNLLSAGVSKVKLSEKFGVARRTIIDIDQGRTWRQVA